MWWCARGHAACPAAIGQPRCINSKFDTHRPRGFRFGWTQGSSVPRLGCRHSSSRPDVNPTIGAPFYYFVPLPAFDGNFDRVTLMSGGYPLGALVSASGSHWDVRGGVTDATPTRARSEFSSAKSPSATQAVVGGGVTPITGMRFGGAMAVGRYRINAQSQRTVAIPDGSYGSDYADQRRHRQGHAAARCERRRIQSRRGVCDRLHPHHRRTGGRSIRDDDLAGSITRLQPSWPSARCRLAGSWPGEPLAPPHLS